MKKRNHKKRHGMNRERSHNDRKADARSVREEMAFRLERLRWRAINRVFWSGLVPDWSTARKLIDGDRSWPTARAA